MWHAVMKQFLGLNRRVVLTDTEWRELDGGRLNRAASLARAAVCCNTRAEIERYSRQFKIPRDNFAFVPVAFQKRDLFEATDEGYVFSGGVQARDWGCLVDAVDGLPYKV